MKGALIAVLLTAGVLLAACAQNAEQRRTAPIAGESLASSVMRAAGLDGHRDAANPRASALGAQGLGAVTGGDLIDIGNIAVSGFAGVLSAVALPSSQDDVSQILAWPPADYAPTAVEAQRRFWGELVNAVERAMPAAGEDATLDVRRGKAPTVTGSVAASSMYVQWSSERCARLSQKYCAFITYVREDQTPEKTIGPAVFNDTLRWAFRYNNGALAFRPLGQTDDFPPRRLAIVDEMTFYEAISRNLPEWAFIYVAPFTAGFIADGSDKPVFHGPPVVLNRGLAHYFVEGQKAGIPLIRNFGVTPAKG